MITETLSALLAPLKGVAVALTMMNQPCSVPEFGAFSEQYQFLIDMHIEANWEPRYLPYKCLAAAQLIAESSGNAKAVSSTGAEGLAQFQPTTFKWLAKRHHLTCSPLDPPCAIESYAIYSMYLIRYFKSPRPDGDRAGGWMTTAYHAGNGSADRAQRLCNGTTLFAEMEPCLYLVIGKANAELNSRYVRRISGLYRRMTGGRTLLNLNRM